MKKRYRTEFDLVTRYKVDSYSHYPFYAEDDAIRDFDKKFSDRMTPIKIVSKDQFIRRRKVELVK